MSRDMTYTYNQEFITESRGLSYLFTGSREMPVFNAGVAKDVDTPAKNTKEPGHKAERKKRRLGKIRTVAKRAKRDAYRGRQDMMLTSEAMHL